MVMVDRLAQLLAENNEVLLRKVQNMIDNSIDNRIAMLRAPEREPRRLADNGGITCEDTTGGARPTEKPSASPSPCSADVTSLHKFGVGGIDSIAALGAAGWVNGGLSDYILCGTDGAVTCGANTAGCNKGAPYQHLCTTTRGTYTAFFGQAHDGGLPGTLSLTLPGTGVFDRFRLVVRQDHGGTTSSFGIRVKLDGTSLLDTAEKGLHTIEAAFSPGAVLAASEYGDTIISMFSLDVWAAASSTCPGGASGQRRRQQQEEPVEATATLMLATERGEIQFGVEANVNLYAAPASGSGTAILKTDNTFSAANVVTAGGADVNEIATAVGADTAKIAANAAKIAALEKRWEERDSNDD